MEFKYGTQICSDPLEDFRNKFYKKVEDEKLQKERELKRIQKNCFHKYSKFVQYNENLTIAVCELCSHAKFTKN
jgi:hypothetical protein